MQRWNYSPWSAREQRIGRLAAALLGSVLFLGCGNGGRDEQPPVAKQATGDMLIFASRRSGNDEIWTVPRAGGTAVRLTEDARFETWWPRPSPSGLTFLAYRSPAPGRSNDYENAALWLFDIDGSRPRELIAKGAHGWTAQGVADWSPDGETLVMAAQEGGRWRLFVTDALGRNPVKISRRDSLFADPSWSPDGTRIVYCALPAGYTGVDLGQLEIHTCDADGGNERRLTYDTNRDHDPYWSPDGAWIAWESGANALAVITGPVDLRAIRPDGTDLHTVLADGQINTVPRWSPDAQSLFFHRLDFTDLLRGWIACELNWATGTFVEIEDFAHTIDMYRVPASN